MSRHVAGTSSAGARSHGFPDYSCERHLVWHSLVLDVDYKALPVDMKSAVTLFRTRAECRAYIERRFGYVRHRPDLRGRPHGWRMPEAVLVRVVAA